MKAILSIVILLSFLFVPANTLFINNLMAQEEPAVEAKNNPSEQAEVIKNKLKDLEGRIKKSIEDENEVMAQLYGVSIQELKKRTEILLEIQSTYVYLLDTIEQKKAYKTLCSSRA